VQDLAIDRYERELAPGIRSYRIKLDESEPSLLSPLEELFANTPELSIDRVPAVITVTGATDLLTVPVGETETKSPVDKFFGYLQWTREGLRKFPYPIVIWIPSIMLKKISIAAPDFWSWRNGVFRFVDPQSTVTGFLGGEASPLLTNKEIPELILPKVRDVLPLDELLERLDRVESDNSKSPSLANLYDRIGRAYVSQILSNKPDKLEMETRLAIDYFQKAIEIKTQFNLKVDRANTLMRLGELYREIGNYNSAIEALERSLLVFREVGDSMSQASALVAMGDVYQKDANSENIERAIEAYSLSLEIYDREDFPEEWARVKNNLAAAYMQRITGDKAENIELAIRTYHESLEVYTRQEFPDRYAKIQNNLAIAYRQRIRGDREENMKRAEAASRLSGESTIEIADDE
jgi:tetratricopeptide (TPR) repeat protein